MQLQQKIQVLGPEKFVFSHGSLVLSANRHGPWLLKLPTHLILKPKESLKQQKSACAWDETSLQKPKVAFQPAREKRSRKRGNPLPVSCKKAKQLFRKKNVIAYLYADVLQKKAKCVMQGSHGLQNWTHRSSVAKLEVCQLIKSKMHWGSFN